MRRICLVGLLLAVLLAGCRKTPPAAPRAVAPDVVVDKKVDPVVPVLRNPGEAAVLLRLVRVDEERHEAALLEAVDFLADRKYAEALASLEKARKYKDTDLVQREIEKVRAVLEQQASADKAVQDIKAVLDDGKPDEAAKLAGQALGQHGDGDRADDLAKLKEQADAVVSAGVDDAVARKAKLKAEADAALAEKNLRAAAVALEQALALGADAELAQQLDDVRGKLKVYDENRALAVDLRRDPARLEEGLACLRKAAASWDTLQVRQEIDEYRLIIEKRRDRVGVVDFEVRGDVGAAAAGSVIADALVEHFRPRFDVVERGQLNRVIDELRLDAGDLAHGASGGREAARIAKARYLVVGSVTPLAGVTVQARLVEAGTGLIVQTARLSAPTIEKLLPRLKDVALMLQMTDEQKQVFEAKQPPSEEVKLIDAAPLATIPPPPPLEEANVVVQPIVAYTPRPAPMGGLVIQDFAALQPVTLEPPPPPPAVELIIGRKDPRRHRLLRLALELGDNLFRRGRCQEAQRHYSLAFTLGGAQPAVALRLDACRDAVPPPPPVFVAAPLPPRPRLAVFGFLLNSPPGLVPPSTGEWAADHFASYCGDYELIDRGEVCWYMGRLGITMREVLRDPPARRCLAQALNARYFVFGAIEQTASFNISTHLIDAETGARTGTAMIHVQDAQEMKLRMHELVRQVGAKPDEQKRMREQAAVTEKSIRESRRLLKAGEPGKAAEVTREALKSAPDNVALQTLQAEALRKQRLAAFETQRRKEAEERKLALQRSQKRQEELNREAAMARKRAEASREAGRHQAQREKAAVQMRKQASEAIARGDNARAVRLLQSAVALKADDVTFRQLAEAEAATAAANRVKVRLEQEKRERALAAQHAAALKRVQNEREQRAVAEADRNRARLARDQAQHDAFVRQAKELSAKKNYEGALAAAQSARRVKATAESAQLVRQAQYALALDDAEKKGAEQRAKFLAERKKADAAAAQAQRNREAYQVQLKKGQEAMAAKQYDAAVASFDAAAKLFRSDAALTGLKTSQDLRKKELTTVQAAAEQKKREMRVKELLSEGNAALQKNENSKAAALFRDAAKMSPGNVEALTGQRRAEYALNADGAEKKKRAAFEKAIAQGKTALKAGKNKEAAGSFQAAVNLYPSDPEAKKLLAQAQAGTAVKPAVTPLTKQREEDYQLAMSAGQAALKKNNFAGAVNSFNEALRLKPGDPAALKGKQAALDAQKPIAPAVDPKLKARQAAYAQALAKAQAAVKAKKYAEAVAGFDEALRQMPGDKVATAERAEAVRLVGVEEGMKRDAAYARWMNSAKAAMTAKKFADAVKAYDEALKIKPGDAAGIKGKQAALEAQKPVKPAIDPKEKKRQEDYKLAMDAARAAVKAKNYAGAVNAYKEAVRLVPGDKAATTEGASAQRLLDAETAMKREAAYAAWMKQGQTAMSAKKYADAVKAYDEALKLKPGDAAGVKGKQAAVEAMKKPATPPPPPPPPPPPVKPASYDTLMQQGATLEAQKKYADAVKAYDQAVKAVVNDAKKNPAVNAQFFKAYMGVGRCEHAAKRYAEAAKAYEEALKRMPNQPDAKAALQRAKTGKP